MDGKAGGRGFEDFERSVRCFTASLKGEARRERRRLPGPAWSIARLYENNRGQAVRKVLDGPSAPCPVPLPELRRHFSAAFDRDDARGGAPRPALPRLPRVESHAALGRPFTPGEVAEKLCRAGNSAPGQDEIPFDLLRRRDPEGTELARIFEGCRRFGRTPAAWKAADAVLVFKEGSRGDPRSWRPLALCSTLYKLYAKGLAARVSQWARDGGALSPQQKGLQAWRGCAEHRFLLQSVLRLARGSGRECALAFLDLEDASGSLPRCHLFETLQELGLPGGFLGLLRELYEGCTMTIKVRGEKVEIPLRRGLKQGCPLSPVLVHLALEPLLRFIDSRSRGFSLDGMRVSVLAYVDDLLLVADDARELQNMLDDATAAADWMGVRFNAGKCRTLHFRGGTCQATTFTVQDEAISCLKEGETFKYLGMPVDFQRQREGLASEFAADVDKISRSRLARWQKADMLKRTVLPKIVSLLRDQPVPKTDFKWIDSETKSVLSEWDPQAGRLTLKELCDIEVVAHALLLLSSCDEVVKAVAHGALRDIVHKSFIQDPGWEDLASYLSGLQEDMVHHRNGGFPPLWTRARYATRRLDRLVSFRWIYNGELCVELSGQLWQKCPASLPYVLKKTVSKKKNGRGGMGNHLVY